MPKKTIKKRKKRLSPEIEYQNKLLKTILLISGLTILLVISLVFFLNSIGKFDYNGSKFATVKEGDLIFYQVAIPVIYNGEHTEYNFYIRNDPRKLDEEIPFIGNITFTKFMVINSSTDLNCEGDSTIAIANLASLYKVIGTKVMKDENASCDGLGRYTYLNIFSSNETKIEQYGPSCYNIHIVNCEILKATERYMTETFVKINQITN